MVNFKIFMVSYDTLDNYAIRDVSDEERNKLVCYAVNPDKPKFFQARLDRVNEWELPWYTPRYQMSQYYEYGSMVHIVKNPFLLKGLTHVGVMHYDMYFPPDSITEIQRDLNSDPNQIFYVVRRMDSLYFSYDQLKNVCWYLNEKLGIQANADYIMQEGWISEALSVVPIEVLSKFAEFIHGNHLDIENMIRTNRWGIMNTCNHRVCGLVERFWGIYLVSLGLPVKKSRIVHDWDRYKHAHQSQKNWII